MSGWQRSGLCLCRSDDTVCGWPRLRSDNHKWTGLPGSSRVASVDAEFPILELCKSAAKTRVKGKRPLFLVLYDGSGSHDVRKAEICSKNVSVRAVQVCSLERIGHVDLLLALAMGFDTVLLQKISASNTAANQVQEAELARAMGGSGRLELYSSSQQICDVLAATPKTAGRWRTLEPAVLASRQSTARACAEVLLPDDKGPVPLPSDAPYGAVQLNALACNMCEGCVWLCPTDALSVSDRTRELLFVESHCIQCGMCRSICPEDALRLEPRLALSPIVDTQKSLHREAAVYCTSCGDPFTVSPVMDRLLTRFLGENKERSEVDGSSTVQKCSTCRVRESQHFREKRRANSGPMHLEPRRGR